MQILMNINTDSVLEIKKTQKLLIAFLAVAEENKKEAQKEKEDRIPENFDGWATSFFKTECKKPRFRKEIPDQEAYQSYLNEFNQIAFSKFYFHLENWCTDNWYKMTRTQSHFTINHI